MNWVANFLPTLWSSKKRKHDQLEEMKKQLEDKDKLIRDMKKRNKIRKEKYNNKDKLILNRDKQLLYKDKQLEDKDKLLLNKDKQIDELHRQLERQTISYSNSYSEENNFDSEDSINDFITNEDEPESESEPVPELIDLVDQESADSSSSTDDESDYSEREIDRPNGQSLNPIIQINELTEINQNFVENILSQKYRSLQGIYIWVEDDIIKFGMVYAGDNPIYLRLKAEFKNLSILFEKKPKLRFFSTAKFDRNNNQSNQSKTLAFKAETNLKTLLRDREIKTYTLTNRLGEYINKNDIEIDLLVSLAQKAWEKAVNEYDELEGDEFTPGDEH